MFKFAGRSFFWQLREKYFKRRLNFEIFNRIFPHLTGEKNFDYSFDNDEEMADETEAFELGEMLVYLEEQIQNMPGSYGKSFRYVLHRDLHERLSMYSREARRRVNRDCDPRFVATHA